MCLETPSRMDARPFLRATSSLHARTTRVRFESRKTLSRLSPHRRFSTRPDLDAKTFPRKAKKKTARAVFGFRVTHPERSQIRRRVLRSVLAEPAREHISRAMSETSASCSLVTHDASSSSPFRCVERKREEEGGGGTSFLLFFQRRSGLSVCFVCVCFWLKNKKKDDTKIMSFFWWECDLKKRKKIILRQKIMSTGFVDFGWGCHFFTTTTRSIPKSVESVYFSLLFSPNMSFRFSLHKSLLLLLLQKKKRNPVDRSSKSATTPRRPEKKKKKKKKKKLYIDLKTILMNVV